MGYLFKRIILKNIFLKIITISNAKFLLFGLVVVATIFTTLCRFITTKAGTLEICQTIVRTETVKSIKL